MLDVGRTRRFFAFLINVLTLNGLLIGGIIALATRRTSFGGLFMGFKFKDGSLVIYFFTLILMSILSSLTLGILWLVDIITMKSRNATFAEKLAGVHKA